MRYKVYLSSSLEYLQNEQLIGGAETAQEACKLAGEYLSANNFHQEPYWRFLMGSTATFIDYGSYSKFIAIVPPLSMADLEEKS